MEGDRKYVRGVKRKPLVIDGHTFHPANDCELTEKELEKARLELGETEEKKKEYLQKLKDKLIEDDEVNYFTNEWYLLRYLRFRKYDVDEAYSAMNHFYRKKLKHPEVFAVPTNPEQLMNYQAFYYLPYTDEEGRIVFVANFARWFPEELPFLPTAVSGLTTLVDIATMNPRCQVNGIVSVWDAKGLSPRHVSEFLNPKRLMLFFSIFQRCFAMRIKLSVIINCNALLRTVFAVVSPFLKKKIRQRAVLIGDDVTELHKYVPPNILPKSLGGALEDDDCRINQDILANLDLVRHERSFTSSTNNKLS